jgi:hypothetical protein
MPLVLDNDFHKPSHVKIDNRYFQKNVKTLPTITRRGKMDSQSGGSRGAPIVKGTFGQVLVAQFRGRSVFLRVRWEYGK